MNVVAPSRAIDPYVRPRAGLGDLPDRLFRQACTVADLGASVTTQKDGYRPRLHELLRQATRQDHRSVFAGTGAMGSVVFTPFAAAGDEVTIRLSGRPVDDSSARRPVPAGATAKRLKLVGLMVRP